MPKQFCKVAVAAKRLGISSAMARAYFDTGHLKGYRTPTGLVMIESNSVEKMIANGAQPKQKEAE